MVILLCVIQLKFLSGVTVTQIVIRLDQWYFIISFIFVLKKFKITFLLFNQNI
jgi:hypothetical protein